MSYSLNSPFVNLTFDSRPRYWRIIAAVWQVVWLAISAGLLYLYAVVFPGMVGFETAVLVGIGLLVLSVGGLSE